MTELADGSTPREVLAAFHRALIALSADDLADLHAPDGVYEFPLLTPDRQPRYVGREQIRAGLKEAWSSAPVRVTGVQNLVVHETTDPEVVIAEQELAAGDLASNEPFVVPFLLVLRVRAGRIVHTRDYTPGRPLAQDTRSTLSLELVTVPVSDVARAKAFYVDQVGFVEVSEIQQFPWGRFCFFSDPDGNGWSVQEPPRRGSSP